MAGVPSRLAAGHGPVVENPCEALERVIALAEGAR